MEPVKLANPENAFEGGVLDKKWMFNVVGHLNLWHAGEVKLPSSEWGSGKILVSNTGWVVDLTRLKVPASSQVQSQREFQIVAFGANTVKIYNGTLFGQLPTGFSVNNSPIKTLTVANGDKIYAKVTWNRTLNITGDIVSTITTRTIEAAATVPANDPQAGTRHYQLATVTVDGGGVVTVSQTRWGPIDDLPGTARYNYYMGSSGTSAQTDYWDLLATGKGKQAGGVTDIAPTYDSIQLTSSAFSRFVISGTNLLIFARNGTLNSQGQFTYASTETKVFDKPVICETTVDVLVGLRLNGGYLEGQYRTIKVNAVTTPSPEWVSTGIPVTAGTTIQCV
jgi:hypothetical protein